MGVKEALIALVSCLLLLSSGLGAQSESGQEPAKPAAQPQEESPRVVPQRIRVGGEMMGAKLVHKVYPKYPKEAKKEHIAGTVRMEALIDRDGKVIEAKVISGDPILAKAATEAVQKWRYRPTLLNGRPVEVLTEVDVNFTLNGR